MTQFTNRYGQPIGESLDNWSARELPGDATLEGKFCRLEPLDETRHAEDLFAAYALAPDGRDWTYMAAGPFSEFEAYRQYAEVASKSADPKHFAVIDLKAEKAVGTLALMRIDRGNGVIEVGNVAFSPLLQQKPSSTEAQFLLMRYVFDELKYRRYEWKCDNLNAPSHKAALRLGFRYEGVFRQAVVYKGRSRDTAWYSIIDKEWPDLKDSFLTWLAPENFDSEGRQVQSLTALRSSQTD